MSFWKELKRRNVYKVGVSYAIVAWLLIQGAAIIAPALQLPQWTLPLVIILLIIGFPLILLFAWAFEITPDGIKRTRQVPLEESITHMTGKKLNYILAGVIVLAVAFILFDNYYLDRRAVEKETASIEPEQVPAVVEVKEAPKTIAVLPFDDLSPEKDQEYFVDGLSEEILNAIDQIPGLTVKARTSSFSFKDQNKTIQEIAALLGVDHILQGSVRKAGDTLRITTRLIKVADVSSLWSEIYNRELKDIFEIQEDIANSVADKMKLTLESLKLLGGTENIKAYELYLIAKGKEFKVSSYAAISQALESIDAAINLDPKFALAWALKATFHILNTVHGPANRADYERDEGLYAIEKAIELEPNLAVAYISLGYIMMNRGKWIEAESALRKALQLSSESFSADEIVYTSLHYIAVGNFKRALRLLEAKRQNDPLNESIRALYVFTLNHVGDTRRGEEEYEHSIELFGDKWIGISFYIVSRARPGVILPVPLDEIPETPIMIYRVWSIAWANLESADRGLIELRQIYDNDENISGAGFNSISEGAAYLGDPEFAMDATEKAYNIDPSGAFHLWLPVKREVRQLPRFKEFVREIGLVDYWNEFGWPDICHELDNGDFECD